MQMSDAVRVDVDLHPVLGIMEDGHSSSNFNFRPIANSSEYQMPSGASVIITIILIRYRRSYQNSPRNLEI